MDYTKYKCPVCGTEHDLKDCIRIYQQTEKKFICSESRRINFKTIETTNHYAVKYCCIRICPKCDNRRKWTGIALLTLGVLALIGLLIRNIYMCDKTFSSIISQIFLVILGGGFLLSLALGVLFFIIEKLQQIDVDRARKYNAIVPIDPNDPEMAMELNSQKLIDSI